MYSAGCGNGKLSKHTLNYVLTSLTKKGSFDFILANNSEMSSFFFFSSALLLFFKIYINI